MGGFLHMVVQELKVSFLIAPVICSVLDLSIFKRQMWKELEDQGEIYMVQPWKWCMLIWTQSYGNVVKLCTQEKEF